MIRTLRAPAAALLSTAAFFALATPAFAAPLDVPAGATYTLTANEAYDTLTGGGEVGLESYVLTIGADGSSSTFNGDISDYGITFVGSWSVSDGPSWYNNSTGEQDQPVLSGVQAAAVIFGGVAEDYRTSTVDNQIANINDKAWYDQWGYGALETSSDYRSDANGSGLYDEPGDSSAYIMDHSVNGVNYAFGAGSSGGGLTKVGAGILTLTGTGNWSGLTTINGGTLTGTTNSISGGSITNNANSGL